MKKRKITPKNMRKVFDKLTKLLEGRPISAKVFLKDFNIFLDERLRMDFFGTEGQCDPRGDHRD